MNAERQKEIWESAGAVLAELPGERPVELFLGLLEQIEHEIAMGRHVGAGVTIRRFLRDCEVPSDV